MRTKVLFVFLAVMSLAMVFLAVQPSVVSAANGTINLPATSVLDGSYVEVTLSNLDPSTAYGFKAGSTWIFNFTTGASQTEQTVSFIADKPASGNALTLYLYTGVNTSALTTLVDSKTLFVNQAGDILGTSLFIDVGIQLLIIGVIVSIVIGLIGMGGYYVKKRF